MTNIRPYTWRNRVVPRENDFGDLFGGFWRPTRLLEEATSEDLVPALDVAERDHEYVVRAEMPGVKKDNIDINLENDVLTITAETRSETEEKEGDRILRQERRYGRYTRSLRLGEQVDGTKVKATYKDGVLELVLSKTEAVKPKKINVDVV